MDSSMAEVDTNSDLEMRFLEAAKNGCSLEVQALLDNKDIVIEAKHVNHALQEASANGYEEVVRALLKAGANIDALSPSNPGRTALRAAAESGHANIVSILLGAGAKIESPPSKTAAVGGHAKIVSILVKTGANIEPQPLNGRTALQAAAGNGHTETVSILLAAGANTNALPLDDGGRTALQAAVEGGYAEIVSILLKCGARVNAPSSTNNGRTALQAAAEGGHVKIMQTLLRADAKINAPPSTNNGRTALQAAAGGGHVKIVQTLLRAGAKVNAAPSANNGRTALQAAAGGGHTKIVSVLLNAGAEIEAPPSEWNGRTALQAAAGGGHARILETLLKAWDAARANAETSGQNETTVAQTVTEGGTVSVSPEDSARFNPDESGQTRTNTEFSKLLPYAAESGNEDIVKMLIEKGADVNIERSPPGRPGKLLGPALPTWPLCIAAGRGYTAVVKQLLDRGADVNVGHPDRTAIRAAAEAGHRDVVEVLLAFGAKIDGRRGDTCLTWGISHPEVVQLLLDKGADAKVKDFDESTLLHAAAGGGHEKVMQILIDAGLDINARDVYGQTCLSLAASPEIVKLLVKYKAEIDLRTFDGRTPLHHAAQRCHRKSVALLLKAGADIESEDCEHMKPLDVVLKLGNSPKSEKEKLLKLLLGGNCNIGERRMSEWRRFLNAGNKDVVIITKTPTQGRKDEFKMDIKLVKASLGPPRFNASTDLEPPTTKRLYSVLKTEFLFPAVGIEGVPAFKIQKLDDIGGDAVVKWQWFLLDMFQTRSGNGLPKIRQLIRNTDKQALLSCYVCFCYHRAKNRGQKEVDKNEVDNMSEADNGNEVNTDEALKTFETEIEKSEISWVMRKLRNTKGSNSQGANEASNFVFRSEDFRSTLDIGWVPDTEIHLVVLLIVDLHDKWEDLIGSINKHLTDKFNFLLERKGKTVGFFESLLQDAKRWRNMQSLLRTQVCKAKDLEKNFREAFYLGGKLGKKPVAIKTLSKVIRGMEEDVGKKLEEIGKETKEMITFELNMVAVCEARISKTLGMSMKRLSWITFIFLPLMFVASLFGMNIDVIGTGHLHWTWVVKFSGYVFALVISAWMLLKLIPIDEWLYEYIGLPFERKRKRVWARIGGTLRKAVKGTTELPPHNLEPRKLVVGGWPKPRYPLKRLSKTMEMLHGGELESEKPMDDEAPELISRGTMHEPTHKSSRWWVRRALSGDLELGPRNRTTL